MANYKLDSMPVIRELKDFDPRSGNLLERLIFNNRRLVILACLLATVVLGYVASARLELQQVLGPPRSSRYHRWCRALMGRNANGSSSGVVGGRCGRAARSALSVSSVMRTRLGAAAAVSVIVPRSFCGCARKERAP